MPTLRDLVGIRGLFFVICTALVMCAGALTALQSGIACDNAVSATRDTGDYGVQMMMESGRNNVELIAAKMMSEVALATSERVTGYLAKPVSAVQMLRLMLSAVADPERTTRNSTWISANARSFIFNSFRAGHSQGVTEVSLSSSNLEPSIMYFTSNFLFGKTLGGEEPPDQNVKQVTKAWGAVEDDFRQFACVQCLENCVSPSSFSRGTPDIRGHIIDKECATEMDPEVSSGACPLPQAVQQSIVRDSTMFSRIARAFQSDPPAALRWAPMEPKVMMLSLNVGATWARLDYPKDGGRIGYVWASIDVLAASAFLSRMALPELSRVYIVQTSPWTCADDAQGILRLAGVTCSMVINMVGCSGDLHDLAPGAVGKGTWVYDSCPVSCTKCPPDSDREGTLFGSSHGDAFEQVPLNISAFGKNGVHDKRPLKAHQSADPVIAAHGKEVRDGGPLGKGFERLPGLDTPTMSEWEGPGIGEYAGTRVLFYQMAKRIQDNYGLLLYVVILVPKSSVLAEIERAVQISEQENARRMHEMAQQRDKDWWDMAAVECVIVGVLMVMSVVFSFMVTRPLGTLQREMEAVSRMDLEGTDEERKPSRLAEVRSMQDSFAKMVDHLREFRNFMPQSVLIQGGDDDPAAKDACLPMSSPRAKSGRQGIGRAVARALRQPDEFNEDDDGDESPTASPKGAQKGAHPQDWAVSPRNMASSQRTKDRAEVEDARENWKKVAHMVEAVSRFKRAPWEQFKQVPIEQDGNLSKKPGSPRGKKKGPLGGKPGRLGIVPAGAGQSGWDDMRRRQSAASVGGASVASKRRRTPPGLKHATASELRMKHVSLLATNVHNFLAIARAVRAEDLVHAHSSYIEVCLGTSKTTHGVADMFSGDRFGASWNAVRPCETHRKEAVRCSLRFPNELAVLNEFLESNSMPRIRCSSGVATGGALCGNMGCEGMKRYSIIGGVASAAQELQKAATAMRAVTLCDAATRCDEPLLCCVYLRLLGEVAFPKRHADPCEMWECMGMREREFHGDPEDADDPHSAFTEATYAYLAGDNAAAVDKLDEAAKTMQTGDDERFCWARQRLEMYPLPPRPRDPRKAKAQARRLKPLTVDKLLAQLRRLADRSEREAADVECQTGPGGPGGVDVGSQTEQSGSSGAGMGAPTGAAVTREVSSTSSIGMGMPKSPSTSDGKPRNPLMLPRGGAGSGAPKSPMRQQLDSSMSSLGDSRLLPRPRSGNQPVSPQNSQSQSFNSGDPLGSLGGVNADPLGGSGGFGGARPVSRGGPKQGRRAGPPGVRELMS